MKQQDIDALTEIAETIHLTMVTSVYGDDGTPALRSLLANIKRIYGRVSPDIHRGIIVIVKSLSDTLVSLKGTPEVIYSLDAFPPLRTPCSVIQCFANGSYTIWHLDQVDAAALAQDAIVYKFQRGTEHFYAGDKNAKVTKVSPTFASNFAIPTFHDLLEALENYKTLKARSCSCKILQDIWHDKKRLFLRVKPEHIMRDSLAQFLDAVLGTKAEVRPEQNMDETKPVDIKVTWFMSQTIAIIEIKWMGASKDKKRITTEYGEARANEGASQLADYLDLNKPQAPQNINRGYLVVYDARRRNLRNNTQSLSPEDALHYQTKEISFDPDFHVGRDDFEVPTRFFLEPLYG